MSQRLSPALLFAGDHSEDEILAMGEARQGYAQNASASSAEVDTSARWHARLLHAEDSLSAALQKAGERYPLRFSR